MGYPNDFKVFGSDDSKTIFTDNKEWEAFYSENQEIITDMEVEYDRRNSAIPLIDQRKINARMKLSKKRWLRKKSFMRERPAN